MNIYQIAKKAGVSTTTVSRVINDRDGVGEDTRKRILELIESTNFQPRISSNNLDNIAFFYKSYPNSFISPYIVRLLNGVNNIVQDFGYNCLLVPLDRIPKFKDEFASYCRKKKIAAGIFANLSFTDDYIQSFENIIPIVLIGSEIKGSNLIGVVSDNENGAFQATSHLIENGHQEILLIASDLAIPDHYSRMLGYKKAMNENEKTIREEYIISYHSQSNLEIILERLLLRNENIGRKPTAAFVCDDSEVIRCMSILEKFKIEIPKDFSIVGFDDYDFSVHLSPPLTTVRQPISEMGESAARIAINKINDNKYVPENTKFETSLIKRKSVKKI